MNWWTSMIRCLVAVGLIIGLLTPVTSESSSLPCDERNFFSCRSDPTICVDIARVKDGSPDCPDKSDEECNAEEFQCQSIHQCIPNERLHDGWPDCDDGSDEECGRGQHRCRCGLPHCVDGHKVKDGVKDCDDGSDESDQRNNTQPCLDESRLQDLMAVEKRRRKRQLDEKPDRTPSMEQDSHYTGRKGKEAILSPSIGHFVVLSSAQNIRRIKPTKMLYKVSTETETYGSLNSGNIYQTAVNEPMSSLSVPKLTVPAKRIYYPKMIQLPNKKSKQLESEKHTNDKSKEENSRKLLRHKREKKKNISDLKYINKNSKKSKSSHAPKREMNSDTDYTSETPFQRRKLLSFKFLKRKSKKLLTHIWRRRRQVNEKSDDTNTEIPLIFSTSTRPKNLYPTGLVSSITGTDVINGRTTEWTTLIEGTYIKGTYAHVVKSTSKIFFVVTKTVSSEPMSFEEPENTPRSSVIHTTATPQMVTPSLNGEMMSMLQRNTPEVEELLPSFSQTPRVIDGGQVMTTRYENPFNSPQEISSDMTDSTNTVSENLKFDTLPSVHTILRGGFAKPNVVR